MKIFQFVWRIKYRSINLSENYHFLRQVIQYDLLYVKIYTGPANTTVCDVITVSWL